MTEGRRLRQAQYRFTMQRPFQLLALWRRHQLLKRKALLIGLFNILIALGSPAIKAHNVVAGAYVDGLLIEGEIAFSNGETAAAGVLVEVFAEDGTMLGETHTQADGLFTFSAARPQAHRLRANLGAGHVADITLAADEFVAPPTTLAAAPTAAVPAVTAASIAPTSLTKAVVTTPPPPQVVPASPTAAGQVLTTVQISTADLEALIRRAVAQQVKPLQRELRAYKEKIMLRDIAGGLGFIFGLFGVAAWMAARKPSGLSVLTATAASPATQDKD